MAGRMVVGGLWWWAVAGGGGRDVVCPRAARRERRRVAASVGLGGVAVCSHRLALACPHSAFRVVHILYYILSHTSSTVRFLVAFDFGTRFLNMVPRRKAAVLESGAPVPLGLGAQQAGVSRRMHALTLIEPAPRCFPLRFV